MIEVISDIINFTIACICIGLGIGLILFLRYLFFIPPADLAEARRINEDKQRYRKMVRTLKVLKSVRRK